MRIDFKQDFQETFTDQEPSFLNVRTGQNDREYGKRFLNESALTQVLDQVTVFSSAKNMLDDHSCVLVRRLKSER